MKVSQDYGPVVSNEESDQTPPRRWLFTFALALAFLLSSFLVCGAPKFETNDDVVMSMIAAGVGFTDQPNDHLLYSHYLIGKLLTALYRASDSTPWYGIYLLTCNAVSISVIINSIWRRGNRSASRILTPLLLLSVCLRPTQLLQFTTAASLSATAGAICLLSALDGRLCWTRLWKPLTTSFCLFALCAFIRFGSAKLIALYAAVFLIAQVMTDGNLQKIKIGLPFLALVVGVASFAEYNNELYYAVGGWSEFYKLNPLRFCLTEFGRTSILTKGIIDAFKAVGWSPIDSNMFDQMYVLDSKLYSMERLRKLDLAIPRLKQFDFSETLECLTKVLGNMSILPTVATAILAVLMVAKRKLSFYSKLFYLLTLSVSTVLMQIAMKLPPYLFSGVIGFTAAAFIWSAASSPILDNFTRLTKAQRVVYLALVLLVVLFWGQAVFDYRQKSAKLAERSQEFKKMLQSWDRRYLYVVWSSALPYEVVQPFDNIHVYYDGLQLAGINFLGRTPITVERLQGFGITDLAGQMNNQYIRLVSSSWQNSLMKSFILEHYHRDAVFEETYSNPELNVKVFKIVETNCTKRENELDPWMERLYVCTPSRGVDLTLYPSTTYQWRQSEMFREDSRQATAQNAQLPVCSHCLGHEADSSKYKATGLLPTLSSFTPLNIKADEMSAVFIEIAVPDPAIGAGAVIEFNAGLPSERKVLIPFSLDKKLHRYESKLDKLDLPEEYLIRNINVHPVSVRSKSINKRFGLKGFGFVRKTKGQ